MKKRTTSLPVLVVVAVVALVIGSFGTATAAGLTKGQVKKIATKVVKKQGSVTVRGARDQCRHRDHSRQRHRSSAARRRLSVPDPSYH